jgi:hypothetical protein
LRRITSTIRDHAAELPDFEPISGSSVASFTSSLLSPLRLRAARAILGLKRAGELVIPDHAVDMLAAIRDPFSVFQVGASEDALGGFPESALGFSNGFAPVPAFGTGP